MSETLNWLAIQLKDKFFIDTIQTNLKYLNNLVSNLIPSDTLNSISILLYYGLNFLIFGKTISEEYFYSLKTYNSKIFSILSKSLFFIIPLFIRRTIFVFIDYYINSNSSSKKNKELWEEIKQMLTNEKIIKYQLAICLYFLNNVKASNTFKVFKFPKNSKIVSIAIGFAFLEMLMSCFRIFQVIKSEKESPLKISNMLLIENLNNENKELTKRGIQCKICLNDCTHPSSTKCGHIFCWNCIFNFIIRKNECPLCRKEIKPQDIVQIISED